MAAAAAAEASAVAQQQGGAAWWRAAAAAPAPTCWPSQLGPAAGPCQQQWRQKHTVRMVLLQDHPRLGAAGAVVDVRAGYARHTLYPSKAADYAVPGVLRRMREQGLLREDPAAAAAAVGRRGRGRARGRAAPAAAPHADGGALQGIEAQLPEALRLLSTRGVTTRRRYRWRTEEQGMVGEVRAADVSALVERQLRVELPKSLVMLAEPITGFGEFKVPLNLAGPDGQQVEVRVEVLKTRRL
ncbi:hypothetical protein Rsub_11028 [Raphidocelis subcapitata]|uniref:Large ribosomal subunit protein bL9c n=1 Tax=Raphidocelis subcapitata TaxID=307507 RepID=A0A2V0PBZ0_9CHLO|nr:hypothetical protein Rsub_11028 [Raphidocelis subcapitata]|eukprot:GBF97381.1 hypothetical protein Rsub_11028 [Raphidocelis subcapitata]